MAVAIIAVYAATVLATVVAAVMRRQRVAKICRILAIASIVGGALAVLSSFAITNAAITSGLSESDGQRMWSIGAAEAAYNFLLATAVAAPALLVSRRVMRTSSAA